MKLSYKELGKLGIDLPLGELSSSFFQLGHEVEEVESTYRDGLIVGQIVELEKHPNADNLNLCQVDIGKETLQIICGAPNVYKGQKVIVAQIGAFASGREIQPIEIKGVRSDGMICSLAEIGFNKDLLTAEDVDGIYDVAADVEVGSDPMDSLELGDDIMDLFLTANRGDCQSYRGLYNDLIAVINYDNSSDIDVYKTAFPSALEVTGDEGISHVIDEELVQYYSTQLLENVEVKSTDKQRKIFLLKHGIKEQNNITDISNEVLLKFGIPTHIYDADTIVGDIRVGLTTKVEEFSGLDGKTIEIPEGILVVRDSEKIIAIAGVMGSEATKITSNTENVLLEVASFDPHHVYKASKVVGKKTDAAIRYEKGIDLGIVKDINNIVVREILDDSSKEDGRIILNEIRSSKLVQEDLIEINLRKYMVEKLLGIRLADEDIVKIFESLHFKVLENTVDNIKVEIPSQRKDLFTENDLVEEIMRIYNIENLEEDNSISTFVSEEEIVKNRTYEEIVNLENRMLRTGLNETITYSLISGKQIERFYGDFNAEEYVTLMSPLSKEHEYYRQSLVPSLLEVAKNNVSRQEKQVNIFEVGNIYHKGDGEIVEELKLSALLTGENNFVYGGNKEYYNFADLRSKLEQLMDSYGLTLEITPSSREIAAINPYAIGDITVEGENIGFIGEVVFDYFKKFKYPIHVFELSVTKLFELLSRKEMVYRAVSTLPQVERDITVEVGREEIFANVREIFEGISYLTNIKLFDIYAGENVDQDKKTLTFRLTFRDDSETLTNEVINEEIEKIMASIDAKGYKVNR